MARTNLTRLPRTRQREAPKVEDARTILDRRIQENENFRSIGLPPDYVSTGLAGAGAGWVFGPVGALIGAAVTQITNQRRRKSILAAATTQARDGASLIEGGEKSIARLEANAVTDQDKFEAAALRDGFEQARTFAQSPNPEMAAAGFDALLNIPGLVSAEADEIEAATIAREQLAHDRQQRQTDNFTTLHGKLQGESQRFIASQEAWQQAQALVAENSPTNDIALIYKMANINDPGAIVTEGDTEVLKGAGSITESMAGFYNKFILGEGEMDDNVRANMIATINTLYKEQRDGQVKRNANFQEIGRAAQLDDPFMRVLRVPVDPREAQILAKSSSFKAADTVPKDAVLPELRVKREAPGSGLIADFAQGVADIGAGIQRKATGTTLLESRDGRRFERAKDGTLTEIEQNDLFEDDDGRELRRIDRGGGRFEWVRTEPEPVRERGRQQPIFQIDRETNE